MNLLRLQLLGSVAVGAALAGMVTTPVAAQPRGLYSGGSTFSEKVYRDVMDCYGASSGGELDANLASPPALCNGFTPYQASIEILYVGSGSGLGLKAWFRGDTHQLNFKHIPDNPPIVGSTDLGSFYGTGVGISWAPAANTGVGGASAFPKLSFVGSDDPITNPSGDTPGKTALEEYNCVNVGLGHNCKNDPAGTTAPKGWGPAIQIPALIGAVALPYSPATAGVTWTENGAAIIGSTSKLNLDTNAWCGIFTGAITDWNDAAITGNGRPGARGNRGKPVTGVGGPSAPITVIYRKDSSGTTFLFVNALLKQCGTETSALGNPNQLHPVPDAWATMFGNIEDGDGNGVSNDDWYDHLVSLLPANFHPATGSQGVHDAINATPGSIGYLSVDFVQFSPLGGPDPTGPKAANVQTYFTFCNPALPAPLGTCGATSTIPIYKSPTPYNSAQGMRYWPHINGVDTSLRPPSFVVTGANSCNTLPEGCATDPAAWGKTNPGPLGRGSYPIVGFSFMDMYSCYASAQDVQDLFGNARHNLGFIRWYFGLTLETVSNGGLATNVVANALHKAGFSRVPATYWPAIKGLLTAVPSTRPGTPGQVNTACEGVTGPGA